MVERFAGGGTTTDALRNKMGFLSHNQDASQRRK